MPLPVDPLILANHLIFPGSLPTCPKSPKIFLPIFQRESVWDPTQVCELWDSLLRGIPLPSLILAKYDPDIVRSSIATKSGTTIIPGKGDYYLIDGQQRARAVLAGLERIRLNRTSSTYSACASEQSLGSQRLVQRLWIDLDWPHKMEPDDSSKTLDTNGLRFGFFLCTLESPWGHDVLRTGRPSSSNILKARKMLFDSKRETDFQTGGNKPGCFDFELSLENTWPVDAKCPVPFKHILDNFVSGGRHSPLLWYKFLKNLLLSQIEETSVGVRPRGITLRRVAKQLFHALPRLAQPGLTCIEADIDADDLIPAFQRINRNGTRVNDEELFFAAIKREEPSCDDLAKQASKTLPPLDVVRGAVILITQPRAVGVITPPKKDNTAKTPPIELSPKHLRSLKKASSSSNPTSGLLSSHLKNALTTGQGSFKTSLDELSKEIAYDRFLPNDPGLPQVMFPRLKVTSWLPPLAWLLTWRENNNTERLAPTQREHLIRYVLMNHFFADWKPSEAELLRHLLEFVQDRASKGNSFPKVCEIRNHLVNYDKPGTGGAPAWLRMVVVSTAQGGPFVLPATPKEWAEFPGNWAKRSNGSLPDYHNYGGLLPQLDKDLLMWAQRKVMDEWFSSHITDIALFGKLGQPWDCDHIVPQSFFNFTGKGASKPNSSVISAASSLSHANNDWSNIRNIANRIGNLRHWPFSENRSLGDKSAREKLAPPPVAINDWEVLSVWKKAAILHPSILQKNSIIDPSTMSDWNATPSNKSAGWDKNSLKAFLNATYNPTSGREYKIYKELFDVLDPDLRCHPDWASGPDGNRLLADEPPDLV